MLQLVRKKETLGFGRNKKAPRTLTINGLKFNLFNRERMPLTGMKYFYIDGINEYDRKATTILTVW